MKWLVINYHYVHDTQGYPFAGLKGNTVSQFRSQVKALKSRFDLLTASQALARMRDNAVGRDICTVCFDDGIRDIYDAAFPVLVEERVKATFFISSQPLFDKRVLSVQKIHLLSGALGFEEFRLRFLKRLSAYEGAYVPNDIRSYGIDHVYRYDKPEIALFKMKLNFLLPYAVLLPVLDALFAEVFGQESGVVRDLYVNEKQLAELAAGGMEIGSHFHTHSVMAFLSAQEQRREVEQGLALIRKFNRGPALFSYPYGSENVWSDATIEALSGCGATAAFSMGRSLIDSVMIPAARWRLPRYSTDDVFIAKSDRFVKEGEYVKETA